MMRRTLFAGLLLPTLALAQGPEEEAAPAPPPPPPPEAMPDDEGVEPEVTIRKRGEDTIEEYRVNGRLYMVKITPDAGPPYYLIDTDGDGSFETDENELDPPEVQQWILFRW